MDFVSALTVFMLAIFVGFEIITKVPPTLHTPLMSGSNAISGISLVGAVLSAGGALAAGDAGFALFGMAFSLANILGFVAVVFATLNVVGGFLVTHRMLGMFKRKD